MTSVDHTTTLECCHRSAALHFTDGNLLISVGVDANISVWKIGAEDMTLADSASALAPSSAGHYAVTSTAVCGRELQITLKFAIHCGASPHSRCYIEHF